jgi:hypothetical protein
MVLLHQDPELPSLAQIVARETGIAAALIEKDYWVTHALWAVVETGLDVWLKGGARRCPRHSGSSNVLPRTLT